MAITQARLIALINAAIAYRRALATANKMATEYIEDVERNGMNAVQALQFIQTTTDGAIMELRHIHDEAIEMEVYHFRRTARYNERQRLRLQQKRIASGVPPRAPAVVHRNETIELNAPLSTRPAGMNRRGTFPNEVSTGLSAQRMAEIDIEAGEIRVRQQREDAEAERARVLAQIARSKIDSDTVDETAGNFDGDPNAPVDPSTL